MIGLSQLRMSSSTVMRSCSSVCRTIAQRVRRMPSGPGRCCTERLSISKIMPVVLPEPTGPTMKRANASESMNWPTVGGAS